MGIYVSRNIKDIYVGTNKIKKICMVLNGVWTVIFEKK